MSSAPVHGTISEPLTPKELISAPAPTSDPYTDNKSQFPFKERDNNMVTTTHADLQAYYQAAFPDKPNPQVSPLTQINNGWESDVYAFDVEHGLQGARQREALILRLYLGNGASEKALREYNGIHSLWEAGYPVPQVYALERNNSPFDKPFIIMERIDGKSMWGTMFSGPRRQQRQLLELFCRLFVQLHSLDLGLFTGRDGRIGLASAGGLILPQSGKSHYSPEDPYQYTSNSLGEIRAAVERFQVIELHPVLDWLYKRQHEVPCLRPSVVHWDFHPNNILLRQDGKAYVIDWTQIEISDPRFDLAWTLLLIGTHESEKKRKAILQEYERQHGEKVTGLYFFDAVACIKRLGSVIISLQMGAEELGMRPGAEEMMKDQMKAIKRVYDRLVSITGIRMPQMEAMLR